jgi:Uma2 family endonuclease
MTYAFTYDQVVKMVEHEILPEGSRVELIKGAIVEKRAESPRHASTADHIAALLRGLYLKEMVRTTKPLFISNHTVPEPDIAVIRGPASQYYERHPNSTEAILVVEISDAHAAIAQDYEKVTYYARGVVPAYWILNISQRRLDVYTHPNKQERHYTRAAKYRQHDQVPLPELDRELLVKDLFIV